MVVLVSEGNAANHATETELHLTPPHGKAGSKPMTETKNRLRPAIPRSGSVSRSSNRHVTKRIVRGGTDLGYDGRWGDGR